MMPAREQAPQWPLPPRVAAQPSARLVGCRRLIARRCVIHRSGVRHRCVIQGCGLVTRRLGVTRCRLGVTRRLGVGSFLVRSCPEGARPATSDGAPSSGRVAPAWSGRPLLAQSWRPQAVEPGDRTQPCRRRA